MAQSVYGRKGESEGYTEEKNTLRSKATARIIDLIAEGPIEGVVGGIKGVYLDNTPIQNSDDSYNYEGINATFRYGLPVQDIITGFPSAEAEINVNTEVKKIAPVIRTITDTEVDAVRVTVGVSGLTLAEEDGSSLKGTTVQMDIALKTASGEYVSQQLVDITGKTTSPYQRSVRIELPRGGAPWSIRVTRITDDTESTLITDDTYFYSYTEIIDAKLSYPDSALVGLEIDAEKFGTAIKTRTYKVRGLISDVPSNYDPITRAYVGLWNGTFKQAWHNNPAWVLYALITNKRFGLGDYVPAGAVDKFGLYTIGRFCDEPVPDGLGGTEPRYTFNGVLRSRQDAVKTLDDIASTFRGMIYWSSGSIITTHDAPATPSKLVTPANVIGGNFEYTGSSLRTRSSSVAVSWNDPADFGKQTVTIVQRDDLIRKFGDRRKSVAALGCTSRGQAHRVAEWTLFTEEYETAVVTYRASLDHADVRPGQIIAVADPAYAGVRFGGRILSCSGTGVVTLDAPLEFGVGDNYSLSMVRPDGEIFTSAILPVGQAPTAVVQLSTFIPANGIPIPGSMWVATSTDAAPRPFRVIANFEKEKNVYEITALLQQPGKFEYIERDVALPDTNYSIFNQGGLASVTSLVAVPYRQEDAGSIAKLKFLVSWTAPTDTRIDRYRLSITEPGSAERVAYEGRQLSLDFLTEGASGNYTFKIVSLDYNNVQSPPQEIFVSSSAAFVPPATPTGWYGIPGYGNIELRGDPSTSIDFKYFNIYGSNATNGTYTVLGTTKVSSYLRTVPQGDDVQFYKVSAVDYSGDESPLTAAIAVIPGAIPIAAFEENIAQEVADAMAAAGLHVPLLVDTLPTTGEIGDLVVLSTTGGMYTWNGTAWVPAYDFDLAGAVTATSFAQGIQPVEVFDVLPTTGNVEGRIVFLTTDGKLYRFDNGAWTASVPSVDITGQLVSNQIADSAITTAKFAAGLKPVEIVSVLPGPPHVQGRIVLLTTDNKMYRNTGTGWTASVPSTDISGTIAAAQIAALEASKITGQMTDAQIAAVSAAKVSGQLVGTQIADAAVTTAKFASTIKPVEILATLPGPTHVAGRVVFLTTDNKLYRNNGTGWIASVASADISGTIAAAQIAALEASKITGQMTDAQIAAVSAAKVSGQLVGTQIADAAITTAKFAAGIAPVEIVATLPATGNFAGRTVFLTTDSKMYRYTGSAWTATVASADISGTIAAAQIAALEASKITGQMTDAQIAAVSAAKVSGQLVENQIADAAITTAKFASTIKPVEILATLPGPTHVAGRVVFLTSDNKLYRNNGTGWIASVASADITGTLAAAQIAALEASKITGQMTDSQIAAVSAAKVSGQLVGIQIADAAITTAKFAAGIAPVEIVATLPATGNFAGRIAFLTTDSKMYRYTGSAWTATVASADISGTIAAAQIAALEASKITGQMTDAQIAAVSAAKVSGQLVGTQIADAAVTTAKFASTIKPVEILATLPGPTHVAGRVVFLTTDNKLYRNNGTGWIASVASADISGTIAAAQIAALEASKITGQMTDAQIAAVSAAKVSGQLVGTQIADAAITTAKFAAGIAPVEIVATLPATGNFAGRTVFLTTDSKMYRYTGSAWTATVASADISGTIAAAQIAALEASKITGQMTDAQIAAVSAAKVSGQLVGTQIADAAITTAKFAAGIAPVEIVATLPVTGNFAGRTVFLTTDSKMYRYTGSAWTATVASADISGTIAAAQIAALEASKITGQMTDAQIAAVSAAKVSGQLVSAQIADAAITTAKFAAGLKPVEVVAVLPSTGNTVGRIVFLTTDNKLYRYDGTAWLATVASADISGTIAAAQIAALEASKITGQMTDAQIAAVSAAKVSGQLVGTQIADAAVTTAKFASTIKPVEILATLPGPTHVAGRVVFLTTDNKLYRNNGTGWIASVASADISGTIAAAQIAALEASKITGQMTDAQIAAVSAAKVSGQLVGTQIADAAITTAKFAAGIAPVEIVATLPATGNFAGRTVFLTTDSKMYRYTGSAWTATVASADISGTIAAAQIAALEASKITGQMTDAQIAAVSAAKVSGQLVENQIADAAITTAKFASTIKPVEILATLPGPTHVAGRVVFLTSDNKLYRNNGTGWIASVASADISGTIAAAQIAALEASKITGQMTDAQIAAVSAAKVSGQLVGTQIADAAITTAKFAAGIAPVEIVATLPATGNFAGRIAFLTTDSKMYRYTGSAWTATVASADISGTIAAAQIAALEASKITGQMTDAQIAAVSAAKVSGQLVENQIADAAITTAKFASTIKPVEILATLPGPTHVAGRVVFLTSDNKLYRNNGTGWIASVASADITGTLAAAQIAALEASKITGQMTDAQIAAVSAAKVSGQLVGTQIADAAITTAKFAAGIEPVEIVATLPATGNFAGRIAFLTTDSKMYRYTGSAWTATVASADISGTIAAAQIAALEASKITGQMTDAQIAAVGAAKLTGQITGVQITDNAITAAKIAANTITANEIATGAITASEIAANAVTAVAINAGTITGNKIATNTIDASSIVSNSITAAQIAAGTITATQIAAGTITATQIATDTITAGQIAAGAIGASEIAANAIIAGKIAANSITSVEIAANTITAAQIAANTISAAQIATGAITAEEIAANAVTAVAINAGTITGNKIATNTIDASSIVSNSITAAQIAAGTITATQIATDTITAGQIAAGAIGASEVAANAIIAGKIAANAITTDTIAANAITTALIAANAVTAQSIATGAITAEELAANAVTAVAINAGTITGNKIATNTIDASSIVSNSITAAQIAAGTITATQIAAGTITATQIATDTITAGQIAAGAIGASEIAANAIIAGKIAANSITSVEIAANTITAAQIAANTISAAQIATGAITASEIAANAVTAVAINAGTITGNKIATNTIDASSIVSNSITAAQIAAGTITATQIATDTITAGQIAAGAIGASEVAANAIIAGKIAANAITTDTIAANAITTALIAANAVTAQSIATGAITAEELAANAVTAVAINAGTITGNKIATNTIDASSIVSNSITAAQIAAGTITATQIATDTITAGQIAAGAIGASEIAANAIIAGKIAANSITSVEIAANTITAAQIAANTISAAQIATGAITADEIAANAVTAVAINAGTITGNKIAANTIAASSIVSNSITAAQIAAGTITATQIATDTITAGQIAAGAITATEIAAGAVTASKVFIADNTNLIVNPSFEDSGDSWGFGVEVTFVAATAPWKTNRVALFQSAAAAIIAMFSKAFPVTAGQKLYCELQGHKTAGVSSFNMQLQYAPDLTFAVITNAYVTGSNSTSVITVSGVSTVPADARYCRVLLYRENVANSIVYIGAPVIRIMASGELIVDGAITAVKIAADTITATQIAAGAITASEIAANAVTAVAINAGTITGNKIATNTIDASSIVSNSITAAQIAAGTITATQIATDTITAGQIAAGAIGASEIAANAIIAGKIAANSITSVEIAANTITAAQIAANTISAAQIATGAITAEEIAANAVTAVAINAGTITGNKIATNTIDASSIVSNSITAAQIAAGTITATQIATDTITAGQIAAGAIGASEVAANAIIAGKIAANAITTDTIAANAITTALIAANAVTAQSIATGAITAEELAANAVTAVAINAGTITGNKIATNTIDASSIVSNSITAAQIAAGTITATQIATDTITAGQIAAGAITATELAAGSVTASKVFIGDSTNLVVNPNLDNSAESWVGGGGTIVYETAASPWNTNRVVRLSGAAASYITLNSKAFPVTPGQNLFFQCQGQLITGTAQAYIQIAWYADYALTSPTYTYVAGTVSTSVTTISGTVVVPATARFAMLQMNRGNIADGDIRIGAPVVRIANSGSLIVDGAITSSKVATDAITATHIAAGTITASEIAANAVTAVAINAGTITGNKIATNTIDASSIVSNSITAAQIAAGTITATQIATDTITAGQIAAGAIGASEVAANAIIAGKIAANAITTDTIAANAITTALIAANAVTAQSIATGAITAEELAANAVTAVAINAGTITGNKIATNTIDASSIVSNSITAAQIAAGTITATQIATDTITAGQIAAGAITASEIATNAITASKIRVSDSVNLWPDGSWATQDAALLTVGGSGTATFNTTVSNSGGVSLEIYKPVLGNTVNANLSTGFLVPVKAGEVFLAEVDASASAAMSAGFFYRLTWYNGAKVFISNWDPVSNAALTTGWTTFSTKVTAPAGAQFVGYELFNWVANTTAYSVYVTRISLQRANAGSLIVDGTITGNMLVANTITANQIATGAITADEIAANAVTAVSINAGTITGNKIATNTINASSIVTDSITALQIAANTITAAEIAADTITAGQIAAGAITATEIAAGAVTATKLLVGDTSNMVVNDWSKGSMDGWTTQGFLEFAQDLGAGTGPNGEASGWRYKSNARDQAYSPFVPMVAGEQYYCGVWVYNDATEDASVAIHTLNYAGAHTWTGGTGLGTAVKNTWVYLEGIVTLPAGAVQGQILLSVSKAATGGNPTYWTHPVMRRASSGELIVDGAITALKIAANTITANQIATGAITAEEIAANAVTAVAINAGTITGNKIATNTIDASSIVSNSITAAQIAAGTITATQIATDTITAGQIAAGAIGASEVAANAIIAGKIAANAITTDTIAANAITTALIAANAVTAQSIATGAITAEELAANAVTAVAINAGTITGNKIATNTIDASSIVSNSITAAQIAAGTITATQIATDTITAGQIAAGAIGATEIAAGAITASKIKVADTVNLWPDGSWATQDPAILTVVGGTATFGAPSLSGAVSLAINKTVLTNSAYAFLSLTYAIPVKAGEVFYAEAVASANTTMTVGFYYRISWYDSAKAYVGLTDVASNQGLTTSWSTFSGKITAPANAQFAIWYLYNHSTNTVANNIYVDRILLQRANAGSLIVDGTITGTMLVADTITATQIAVGAITASEIAANAVTAVAINAGTITGNKISTNTITASNIATATITANQIAAGTITTGLLAADSITSGLIAAGAVTASEIAVGAVTAEKLNVGSFTNLLANGDFADPLVDSYWTNVSGSGSFAVLLNSVNSTYTQGAPYALNLYKNTLGGVFEMGTKSTARFVVSPSQPLFASISYKSGGAAAAAGFYFRINWYNAAGTYLSYSDIALNAAIPTSWTTVSGSVTPPANSAFAGIALINFSTQSVTQNVYISKIEILNKGTGQLIVDGTITTANMAANSITATLIAANAVTATSLAADSVIAGKIAVGAVSANQIVAGAITATKLAIGDTSNIYADPDFVDINAYINETGANWFLEPNLYVGSSKNYLSIYILGGVANPTTRYILSPFFTVEPNLQYQIASKIGTDGTGTATTAELYVLWYSDLAGTTFLSTSIVNTQTGATGLYTRNQTIVTAPAGAVRGKLQMVRVGHATSTHVAVFHEVVIRRAVAGELIVDGTITGSKIQANAITSGLITAGAISADKISALAISSPKIQAGAVTAAKLDVASLSVSGLAVFGNTLSSTGFVSGSTGWRIQNDGNAEFNGVVLSRNIVKGSGEFASDIYPVTGVPGIISPYTKGYEFIFDTGIAGQSWTPLNEALLASVGMTSTTAYSTLAPNVKWAWSATVFSNTNWSGSPTLWIRALLLGFNLDRIVGNVTWKIYKVT